MRWALRHLGYRGMALILLGCNWALIVPQLAAGDLLAVEVRQESGGSLNVYNVESFGSFALALIHAE